MKRVLKQALALMRFRQAVHDRREIVVEDAPQKAATHEPRSAIATTSRRQAMPAPPVRKFGDRL